MNDNNEKAAARAAMHAEAVLGAIEQVMRFVPEAEREAARAALLVRMLQPVCEAAKTEMLQESARQHTLAVAVATGNEPPLRMQHPTATVQQDGAQPTYVVGSDADRESAISRIVGGPRLTRAGWDTLAKAARPLRLRLKNEDGSWSENTLRKLPVDVLVAASQQQEARCWPSHMHPSGWP